MKNIRIYCFLIIASCSCTHHAYSQENRELSDFILRIGNKWKDAKNGELSFRTFEGTADQDVIIKFRDRAKQLGSSASVSQESFADFASELEAKSKKDGFAENLLTFRGNEYIFKQTRPASMYDARLLKHANIKEQSNVTTIVSLVDDLYGYYEPFQKTVQVSRPALPPSFPVENVWSIDPTTVDYSNLLKPIPGRRLSFNIVGDRISLKTQMTESGFEQQSYFLREGIPYIERIEGLLQDGKLKADKFFLNYVSLENSKNSLLVPKLVVDLYEMEGGESKFKVYKIAYWKSKDVKIEDLLLDVPEGAELIESE